MARAMLPSKCREIPTEKKKAQIEKEKSLKVADKNTCDMNIG